VDADKWSDFYDRTKESDGLESAMNDLANGFVRELKSRAERAPRGKGPREVLQEVDEMWRSVAENHEELSPEGFQRLLVEASEELAEFLD